MTKRVYPNNFTTGIISRALEAKTDFKERPHGVRRADNVIINQNGGVRKRPGLRSVAELPNIRRCFTWNKSESEQFIIVVHGNENAVAIYNNDGEFIANTVGTLGADANAERMQVIQQGDTMIFTDGETPPKQVRLYKQTARDGGEYGFFFIDATNNQNQGTGGAFDADSTLRIGGGNGNGGNITLGLPDDWNYQMFGEADARERTVEYEGIFRVTANTRLTIATRVVGNAGFYQNTWQGRDVTNQALNVVAVVFRSGGLQSTRGSYFNGAWRSWEYTNTADIKGITAGGQIIDLYTTGDIIGASISSKTFIGGSVYNISSGWGRIYRPLTFSGVADLQVGGGFFSDEKLQEYRRETTRTAYSRQALSEYRTTKIRIINPPMSKFDTAAAWDDEKNRIGIGEVNANNYSNAAGATENRAFVWNGETLTAQVAGGAILAKPQARYVMQWNPTDGYPISCEYRDNRLLFMGSRKYPNRIWASAINNAYDFTTDTPDAQTPTLPHVEPDFAVERDIGNYEAIIGTASHQELIIFTKGDEWGIQGAFVADDISRQVARKFSSYGSRQNVGTAQSENIIYFASGNSIYAMQYNAEGSFYQAINITNRRAEDLFIEDNIHRIVAMRQHEFNSANLILFLTNDGKVKAYHSLIQAKFSAWAEWQFSGTPAEDGTTTPLTITDIISIENSVFLTDGSNLYILDDEEYTDNGNEFEVRVETPDISVPRLVSEQWWRPKKLESVHLYGVRIGDAYLGYVGDLTEDNLPVNARQGMEAGSGYGEKFGRRVIDVGADFSDPEYNTRGELRVWIRQKDANDFNLTRMDFAVDTILV